MTTKKFAKVIDGLVENVIVATDSFISGLNDSGDWIACGEAATGWTYDGVNFVEPPPVTRILSSDPLDYPLQPYQFHAMLEIAGKTVDVQNAIDVMTDPAAKAVANARMKFSAQFDRDDPLVDTLAAAVGLTPAEVDALWLQAKDL